MSSHLFSDRMDDPESSFEDPTSVLKVLADYQASHRRRTSFLKRNRIDSTSHTSAISSTSATAQASHTSHHAHSAVQQHLRFDDSGSSASPFPSWGAGPKLPRLSPTLGPDPWAGAHHFPPPVSPSAASSAVDETSRRQIAQLEQKLSVQASQILDAQTQVTKYEAQMQKMALLTEKDRWAQTSEREKRQLERDHELQRREELEFQVQKLQKRLRLQSEQDHLARRRSRESGQDEQRNYQWLGQENAQLKQQALETRGEFQDQRQAWKREKHDLEFQIRALKSDLEQKRKSEELEERGQKSREKDSIKLERLALELQQSQAEVQRLTLALEHDQDATLTRNIMREQLAHYPQLLRENEALKRENKLLNETAENGVLLQEQISDLQSQMDQAQQQISAGQKSQSDLMFLKKTLRHWENLCLRFLSEDDRARLAGKISPDIMTAQIGELQRKELGLIQDLNECKSECSGLERRVKVLEDAKTKVEKELTVKKNVIAEQSGFVKKLQRKIFLVAKERDSYKSVLGSYEQEITFTGGNFERDRIASLEKVVSEHQSMIEKLETLLAQARSGSDSPNNEEDNDDNNELREEIARLGQELETLTKDLEAVRREKDDLELELEKRAIRGDYNPTEAQVLHFGNNPMSQAVEGRGQEFKLLQAENEALKARVKLLKEGQSRDLTVLVGQKMDEGASSQEVKDLNEQLKLAEIRQQRLLEAFKKTSTDFREVICQLTGFKINVVEDLYSLYPIYNENQDDHLAFKYSDGQCHMLETEFSSQLGEFIDLHLKRQNSIPVFLAAVISDLFSRQTFETISMSITTAGEEEDDPICLD